MAQAQRRLQSWVLISLVLLIMKDLLYFFFFCTLQVFEIGKIHL